MAEENTFAGVRTAMAAANPTDAQFKAALTEIYAALVMGGKACPVLLTELTSTPTDASVRTAVVGSESFREVYDGMIVAILSGNNIALWIRRFGVWKAVVAAA